MIQRFVTAMVVALVALWGAGLPRFAHVMVAHVPGAEPASACASCCSQCSLSTASFERGAHDDESREGDGSTGTHRCAICELLATLASNVPSIAPASVAWQPIVERVIEERDTISPRLAFDPHAPRGPPAFA